MGGSVSFTANTDSLTELGKKSILTSEIEGVSADKFLEGIEKYVRDGKAASGYESNVEVADKDGGILVTLSYPNGAKVSSLYKFDRASSQVEILTFPAPILLEKGAPTTTTWLKVLSEPVRIESWVNVHGERLAGPMLKGIVDNLLAGLDATVDTAQNAPSLTDPSKLSVVSGPIEGKLVDADSFLDMFSKFQIDSNGATELPDGSLVAEVSNLVAGTTYIKHMISKDDKSVYTYDYGSDSSMSDLRGVATMKVHRDPFRLEMWRKEEVARRAGEDELKLLQPLVEGVLKAMAA